MQKLREDSRHIFAAGVAAVDPIAAVQRAVVRQGNTLYVDSVAYDLQRYTRVYVVGAGKAGATMARGLEEVLGERLTAGVVTVKYGHRAPVSRVTIHEAAHPVPDEAGGRSADVRLPGSSARRRTLLDDSSANVPQRTVARVTVRPERGYRSPRSEQRAFHKNDGSHSRGPRDVRSELGAVE